MPSVDVSNLCVSHGQVQAVRGISFSIEPGEVVGLLGPNGAGKTSTVEVLSGLRSASGGSVRVLDLDPSTDRRNLANHLGYMPQEPGLPPGQRVKEALRHYSGLYKNPRPSDDLVERLGLHSIMNRTVKQLSGGERQRLSLALALICRPIVALLDEPTAGVDPAGRVQVRELIAETKAAGASVLLTSHELQEVELLCSRIILLKDGLVTAQGTLAELGADRKTLRIDSVSEISCKDLSEHAGVEITEIAPGIYVSSASAKAQPDLARVSGWMASRGYPINQLEYSPPSLESLYLSILGHPDRTEA